MILREAVSLEELPQHAVIGTGSRRRRAFQLLQLRKDLRITGIRGNVDTRIKKMQEEQLDGIVLAAAGLHRLGRTSLITQYFEPEQMIPAAAQGTLALELREDDKELFEQVNALSDIVTEEITCAERLFLKGTGGDCHMPIGAYACGHEFFGKFNVVFRYRGVEFFDCRVHLRGNHFILQLFRRRNTYSFFR